MAVDDESVMVAGLDDWPLDPGGDEELWEPRLHIEGKRLRLPPGNDGLTSEVRNHIPVVRFPRWYYCADPSCRRLDTFGRLSTDMKNSCTHCGGSLIPSRFIAVCSKGHIEDFPYWSWIHQGQDAAKGRHDLRLRSTGGTGSLAGIVVACVDCELERSMDGAFDRDALAGVRSCGGQRPWLTSEGEDCGERLRTTQRGASNVWFPSVRSVLSIPPWSDGLQRFVEANWTALRHDLEPPVLKALVEKMVEPARIPYSSEEVLAAVRDRKGVKATSRSDAQIRAEEYRALCQGRSGDSSANFVAEVLGPPEGIEDFVDLVTVVTRLREVRAFTGFTRLQPATESGETCAISLGEDWLPATAVHGEGIFLRLKQRAIDHWEQGPPVAARVSELQSRWQKSYLCGGWELTGRFLLAHTLAHGLIEEWALAGGYPAASLRERVYEVDGEVGILIYTAAADSAGSLGGLIAQAEPRRLKPTLVDAVRRLGWCSSDPVCAETRSQGAEGLNLAACHACALLPETSCEHRNGLLDRAMLVGLPDDRTFGFFRGLMGD